MTAIQIQTPSFRAGPSYGFAWAHNVSVESHSSNARRAAQRATRIFPIESRRVSRFNGKSSQFLSLCLQLMESGACRARVRLNLVESLSLSLEVAGDSSGSLGETFRYSLEHQTSNRRQFWDFSGCQPKSLESRGFILMVFPASSTISMSRESIRCMDIDQ